jgi:hypothetical protein
MQDPAIRGATVHTGPGSDLVFLNNLEQAAIDLRLPPSFDSWR